MVYGIKCGREIFLLKHCKIANNLLTIPYELVTVNKDNH
uniref:Uncharacterized protein n=1 Tax=Rhizophora mucronata TaxID=61149 RepID=A0A2P2PV70_RHIMU